MGPAARFGILAVSGGAVVAACAAFGSSSGDAPSGAADASDAADAAPPLDAAEAARDDAGAFATSCTIPVFADKAEFPLPNPWDGDISNTDAGALARVDGGYTSASGLRAALPAQLSGVSRRGLHRYVPVTNDRVCIAFALKLASELGSIGNSGTDYTNVLSVSLQDKDKGTHGYFAMGTRSEGWFAAYQPRGGGNAAVNLPALDAGWHVVTFDADVQNGSLTINFDGRAASPIVTDLGYPPASPPFAMAEVSVEAAAAGATGALEATFDDVRILTGR